MKKVKTGNSSDRSPPSGDLVDRLPNNQKNAQRSKKAQAKGATSKLRELESRLADDLPIDAQRINDMKNAIANGEYQVDAESIANKMIDLESSLKK